jgi:aminoglycoside 2'-N-acetyltransferase I
MARLQLAHTSELDAGVLAAIHSLLDAAFVDDPLTDEDWEHALGGMHALLWEGDELVGHASVVQRRLVHGGRALRAGYVEAVAVRQDQRRRGHGSTLMEAVERVLRGAYDLGALGATAMAMPLYLQRGWQQWRGPTSALTPRGVERTPDADDCLFVLPVTTELDVEAELTCDWRDGDVW